MTIALPILVSTAVLATIAIVCGLLLNSLSRYNRAYRIGPIRYRKVIVDNEPTYCFQIDGTFRQRVTSTGSNIATT